MPERKLRITDYDLRRLKKLLEMAQNWPKKDKPLIDELKERLNCANITSQKEVPQYLVTMNCHIRVTDLNTQRDMDFWLAFPDEASFGNDKVSILSPIGIVYPYPLSRQKLSVFKVDSSPCVKAVGTEGARRATGVPTVTPYTSAGVR